MNQMKRFLLIFSCLCAIAGAAELSGVRTVYVTPMPRGLDQFLANRLTTGNVLKVVVDPKLADAILTDRLGETLNTTLDEVAAAQKPAPAPDEKDAKKDQPPSGGKLDNPSLSSTFGRAKGTLFLVESKSRQVVWSTFELPKGPNPAQLDRAALDIAGRLKRDLTPGKQ